MRWLEIMEAGEAGYLYHWMDMSKTEHVFETDCMEARWEHEIDGRLLRGNSFSRNKVFSFGEQRFVRLIVDKRILASANRIIPLDAELVHRKTKKFVIGRNMRDRVEHARSGAQFAEEFVIGDIHNLHRAIVKVDVRRYHHGGWHSCVKFIQQYCNRFDIPCELSDVAVKHMAQIERDWNEDDEEDTEE